MINVIVKFLEAILSVAAALIVIAFGIAGFAIPYSNGSGAIAAIVVACIGSALGFVVAAVLLGIPMLLLQINRNLEAVNSKLAAGSANGISTGISSVPTLNNPLRSAPGTQTVQR